MDPRFVWGKGGKKNQKNLNILLVVRSVSLLNSAIPLLQRVKKALQCNLQGKETPQGRNPLL